MRAQGLIVLVCTSGCQQLFGLETPVVVDGGVMADASDGSTCSASWASAYFDTCAVPLAGGALSFDAQGVIDTSALTITGSVLPSGIVFINYAQGVNSEAALLLIDSLVINQSASVRVIGSRPLMIAAHDSIMITGSLDASSSIARGPGAGSNPFVCGSAGRGGDGVDEADSGGGSGGGGGGGFLGDGGQGGPGDNGQNAGGAKGQSVGTPTVIRGGCSGGPSGKAGPDPSVTDPDATAAGGAGGGGVLLSSGGAITIINGTVAASGAGGRGSPINAGSGGGGGGAGGMIVLEAPMVDLKDAVIAANGGAGGSGAQFASVGVDGQDGRLSATAAIGGTPNASCAAPGANGSGGASPHAANADQTALGCGGAGGGGGAGNVVIATPSLIESGGTIVSPPAIRP